MKNNKLFNKVLSKSAMLLMVAGITMSSGAAFNVYAQEVPASNEVETTQASVGDTESEATTTEAVAKAKAGNTTSKVKCTTYTWSKTYYTSQNCKPNTSITVKPGTNKPSVNKPNTDTSTPSVDTPNTNTPSVDTPNTDTNTPSVDTPNTDTNTPSVNTPNTNTPSVDTPDTDTNTPNVDTPNTEDTQTPSEEVSNQTAFENEVLRLVNVERTKAGLSPLQMDESIRNVARVKATDMYKNRYFDHTSPTYGTPFDMLKKYGISYKAAGENIAKGQTTPQQVVNSWMNSSGHRANILSAKYTHIGIGYEANGNHWVQMFVGK